MRATDHFKALNEAAQAEAEKQIEVKFAQSAELNLKEAKSAWTGLMEAEEHSGDHDHSSNEENMNEEHLVRDSSDQQSNDVISDDEDSNE